MQSLLKNNNKLLRKISFFEKDLHNKKKELLKKGGNKLKFTNYPKKS